MSFEAKNDDFLSAIEEAAARCGSRDPSDGEEEGKLAEAVKLAEEGSISTSLIQRHLGVGYGRAARIAEALREMGYEVN